jgi:hypothetical protein
MCMVARGKGINLLVPSKFGQSFGGKFLKWAVTSGRYVVIVTEMVVVLAFLSRFKLDTDLSRLNSTVAERKMVLDSLTEKETEFKSVQKKVDWVNQILNRKIMAGEVIPLIVDKTPEGVRFLGIKFDEKSVNVNASAANETVMGLFLDRLNRDPDWESVDLSSVAEDKTEGLTFTVNVRL